ncbi:uncharacterized protein [Nicotiana sylvestris]|uniref:uncharacterized protein n=1 Tax=Nicotiana sylvestris TaxID=4096 RepID=UPI00388C5B6E
MANQELDASVIDPLREGEESDVNLKEELYKLKHQMVEIYQAWDHNRWYTWDDLAQAFARHFQYIIEIVPDRLSLTKIEKKPNESFREYGFRWREHVARVNPLMEESEMVEYFLQALEPTYFGHLISTIGKSFNKVVKMGGMVEEGLKLSKIMSCSAIKATNQAIQNGRCFAPEELRKAKISRDNPVLVKKAVTEEEAEEFLRKMKVQNYSIVEQLRKTHAQISLLSLLIHSYKHRRALMKILNEAHVPNKISVNHLEKIANKIFEVNMVTFSNDELPMEGTKHNRALYLTIKCEDYVVTRVLVVSGSNANICPLCTLNKLKVDDERIHKNNICVRAVSYNLLLGRPWIHTAKAVPSTLHQMVKFEWDRQEIFVVHGEDNLYAHRDASVPLIEVEDDKGPWVYQVFETVPVEKVPEGKYVPTPKITSASVMVAFEMLKNGFVPSKGLGASLQDIIQPVSLPKNLGTFGLGFKSTVAYVKRAKRLKQKAWGLSTDLVVHKLPIDPAFSLVRQKLRKFKSNMSVKIKEEVTKQLDAMIIRVMWYPTWLANVVPVPKKDGKTRVCVNYRDLNKNLKLNPAKCAFGVPFGKLLGFIIGRRGIELDPSKIKAIQELPPPKNKTEVMSLLGRLNYINRFIAQLTTTCETIFKLLRKDAVVKWTDECQEAFDKITGYLSNPPVLVPPELGRPFILYLIVLDNSFGCVLGQHDITGRKEQSIYYLSKKFTSYEVKYTPLERTCCVLTWFRSIEFRHIPRIHNEVDDALATLASMLHHLDKAYVDPLHIQVHDQHAYCNMVEEEPDGYRTTVRTSVGATPYLLVYGTEAVIPAEVEIPSLRVVAKAEIDDDEWVKTCLEQLSLIYEKRLAAVCHDHLYQKSMARSYNKKVHPRKFEVG